MTKLITDESVISLYKEVKTGLAFPTLMDIIPQVVFFVVGVPIVYLFSKALKLRPKPLIIADPRKEAPLVFLVIMVMFIVSSAWNVFTYTIILPTLQPGERPPFDVISVLFTSFIYATLLLPLILVMKRSGQNHGSIGITGENMWRMLALGLLLSAVFFTVIGFYALSSGGGFTSFSPSLAYGLIAFTINSFSEEIVWRGYTQTRLIAYGGTLKGVVATSLLFALWHFPTSYHYFGVALEALASALLLFPISLLFGYIMIRSQNIIPSSIFHLFCNWSILFWRIPTL